jgi:hypothetical protein
VAGRSDISRPSLSFGEQRRLAVAESVFRLPLGDAFGACAVGQEHGKAFPEPERQAACSGGAEMLHQVQV